MLLVLLTVPVPVLGTCAFDVVPFLDKFTSSSRHKSWYLRTVFVLLHYMYLHTIIINFKNSHNFRYLGRYIVTNCTAKIYVLFDISLIDLVGTYNTMILEDINIRY